MNLFERLTYEYQKGSMIIKLIMINVAVFIVTGILFSLLKLFNINLAGRFMHWFALHSNLEHLLITPWTFITSGFIHSGFLHILFNMLWLYWIGRILEEYIGSRKVLPIYIYGVLLGGLFYVISFNVFPLFETWKQNSFAIGASAGVMAIIWATVALLPDYKIRLFLIGTVPLIYIALLMSVLDLLGVAGNNAGGRIAHLGGALMGYLFIQQYRNGNDLAKPFNSVMDWLSNLFSRRKPKLKVKYRRDEQEKRVRPKKRKVRKKEKVVEKEVGTKSKQQRDNEKQLNAILDKISENGYESLTKAEKEFLFQKSQDS